MRVFVLGTGRCGTTTIKRAFEHSENYTSGHETWRHTFYYPLDYPDWHVESDNRLAWFLGDLDKLYSDALYIHLVRDCEEFVASIVAGGARSKYRKGGYILRAFGAGILQQGEGFLDDPHRVARRLWHVVNTNIEVFLRDKQHMTVWLHELTERFPAVWEFVGAEGDIDAAVAETRVRHNARRRRRRMDRPA